MSAADDARVLNAMFCTAAVVPLKNVDGKQEVVLTERNAPDSQMRIRALPVDSVVVKIGDFPDTRSFFAGGNNLNHRADYMILCPSEKVVVYIEMKRGRDKSTEIAAQLRGAMCAGKFIQALGREHFGQRDFLKDYRRVFVGFSHATVDKRVTGRPGEKGSGTTPEDRRRINFAHQYQFRRLVA